jgi:hypothetical protein
MTNYYFYIYTEIKQLFLHLLYNFIEISNFCKGITNNMAKFSDLNRLKEAL